MTFRPLFFTVHRYLGLVAALPLILAGVTGALLVFEAELDRALNPAFWSVQPQGQPLSWQEIVADAEKQRPKDSVTVLRLPPSPDIAAEVGLKGGLTASIDPYTGRMIGTRRRDQTAMTRVHQFHVRLLMGEVGGWINGTSAVILLVLSISGLVLWWRRKGLGIKWSAPWRRVNFDAHHALGLYAMLPWMALGLSGAAMTFEKWVQPALYAMTRSNPPPAPTELFSTPAPNAMPITIDAALASARKVFPGAEPTFIMIPAAPMKGRSRQAPKSGAKTPAAKPPGVFMVFMKYPEDRTPAGRSRVALDQFSGLAVWSVDSRTAPAGTRAWNLNRPIHTGDIFGWPTRILACAASALLVFQSISGIWLWWPRKARKAVPSRGEAHAPRTLPATISDTGPSR